MKNNNYIRLEGNKMMCVSSLSWWKDHGHIGGFDSFYQCFWFKGRERETDKVTERDRERISHPNQTSPQATLTQGRYMHSLWRWRIKMVYVLFYVKLFVVAWHVNVNLIILWSSFEVKISYVKTDIVSSIKYAKYAFNVISLNLTFCRFY